MTAARTTAAQTHEEAPPGTALIGRRCERAVITAYVELRGRGNNDPDSFRACTTLYRIHHPEASITEARALVAEWIDHHIVRAAPGATPGCECD